ncbi:MAG TPA: hypothetical protein VH351_23710 [Bryobacteraceae bacterium]|jgi:hypothetical protein|nr:hypothetical protein [Bryobacteraceae bacterium]
MTRSIWLMGAALAGFLLFACSPDVGPFFTPLARPEDQAAFNKGRLGLLTPALTKENELIAFRLLNGLAVPPDIDKPKATEATPAEPGGPSAWLAERKTISTPPAPAYISAYRSDSTPQFVYYLNCLDNAFETAARTLADRRRTYGAPDAVTAWAVAQDQVFANCSSNKPQYPESLNSNAPVLIRADREYQIASAHFYAEDLDEAERRYRAIAEDAQSPWRQVAGYMVGRTLLREVSLKNNTEAAAKARDQFTSVAQDKAAGSLAISAGRMVEHLDAIEHPDNFMAALSKQLLLPQPQPEALADTLRQSAYILRATSFSKALAQPNVAEAFDWVQTLETGQQALEKWKAKRSLPWLTVSLIYASGKEPEATELIQQAERLPPDSPAFGTAAYNAIRLRIERGETEQPRRQLDTLLANKDQQPDSLVNGWRAERMRVSANFPDLLRWASRKPIGAEYFFDKTAGADEPVLAEDAAFILNYKTPLAKLNEAAHSGSLPPWSASDVALSAWVRAFMLNQPAAASQAASILRKDHADWLPGLAVSTDAERFRAALLIALHHEFQPLVPVDYRKHFQSGSWWCTVSEPAVESPGGAPNLMVAWRLPAFFTPSENVISKEEASAAKSELERLNAAGSAPSFLAPIIMAWAKQHPDDPLVPQALHRLVFVVRYGCRTGNANGRISKAAFDLLHQRYPDSEWTKKTPYWFN